MARRALIVLAAGLAVAACGSEDVLATADTLQPTYTQHVRPLLEQACVPCHTRDGLRAGGVELDAYETAVATGVKNACVSVTPAMIEAFADVLQPAPRDPPQDRPTCADWKPFSMPPDALDKLTPHEQVILLRWLQTGAPR